MEKPPTGWKKSATNSMGNNQDFDVREILSRPTRRER
jgi:hypothetical protein